MITIVKIYADESRSTVLERATAKTRNEFVSLCTRLKEKYNSNLPVWAQVGGTIISDAALSNVFETGRLMRKGIL